ncbi:FAD-dependent oxidoreductase [Micromonospora soli]|uniref:NAD(P)/FAD-dependent oxidoreductase n=1 Tax=Micromonospora sp. NBRC 110009 TaxID=3061627 RepID=UPI002672DBDA|nr:FAD-dependent oxidoreductase [Micromonospora sp. NBRC 110009]WKT98605.1 FAD-dependent oxidoreductase [Micromonospora sp. NBRC 110009]
MTSTGAVDTDVAIIGAGPAGLAAAIALRQAGVARVTVLERETVAGGIPRHCNHTGYGIRDLHRFMTGPRYAQSYLARATAAGAQVLTSTMVTGWAADGGMQLTSPAGRRDLHASAVLLATGARERPRTARRIPGDRGAGVFTTGQLQQAVYLFGQSVGTRALVVGAEHVSYSAVMTLRHAGVDVIGMLTDRPHHHSYAAFALATRIALRVPLRTGTRVVEVQGRPRVTGVVVEDTATGHRSTIACDTVVFTGDWIPDHELARARGLTMNPGTRGPAVDAGAATEIDGLFATGNLCHPVETADVAALSGRAAGHSIARWLADRHRVARQAGVPIEIDESFEWVHPQRASTLVDLPRNKIILRPRVFATASSIRVMQEDRCLWSGRVRHLVPTRPALIPTGWLARVDPAGTPIRIESAPSAHE